VGMPPGPANRGTPSLLKHLPSHYN
jgi:hypothetical protein